MGVSRVPIRGSTARPSWWARGPWHSPHAHRVHETSDAFSLSRPLASLPGILSLAVTVRRALPFLFLFLAVACGADDAEPDVVRVALVTPGSVTDAAWNAGAYAGLQQLRDSLFVDISHV